MPESFSVTGEADSADALQGALQQKADEAELVPEAQELVDAGLGALRELATAVGEGPVLGSIGGQASEGHTGVSDVGAADVLSVTVQSLRRSE